MGLIPYLLEKFISKNLAEIFELDQDSFDHQVIFCEAGWIFWLLWKVEQKKLLEDQILGKLKEVYLRWAISERIPDKIDGLLLLFFDFVNDLSVSFIAVSN